MKRIPGYHYHRCRCGSPGFRTPKPEVRLCGFPVIDARASRCHEPPMLLRIVRDEETS